MLTSLLLASAIAVNCSAQTVTPQVSERAVMRISREVQKGILQLPNYGLFDDIRFQIRGYEVILKGAASRPTLKSSAEQIVRKIEGVEKVTNQIEVLPLSTQDDDIRLAAYIRIYGHQTLSRYNPNRGSPLFNNPNRAGGITNDPPPGYHPVHIIVKNGNITLEGVVDSILDRTVAEMQANGVSGAFSVTSNIQVANQERQADSRKSGKLSEEDSSKTRQKR